MEPNFRMTPFSRAAAGNADHGGNTYGQSWRQAYRSGAGQAPFVEVRGGEQDPWVNVSVNWERIENAFKSAAYRVSRGAGAVRNAGVGLVRGMGHAAGAGLGALNEWMKAVLDYLKRLFGSARRLFSPVSPVAAVPGQNAGQERDGADNRPNTPPDVQDLSADLPQSQARQFIERLDAWLEHVVPVGDLDAQRLPADLPRASVAALSAAQAEMALMHYMKASDGIDGIDNEIAKLVRESPFAQHFVQASVSQMAATVFRLYQDNPDSKMLKMMDPKGEIVELATRARSLAQMCRGYLEAASFDLYVGARAGLNEHQVGEILGHHGMTPDMLVQHLHQANLGPACEAFIRRRDPQFDFEAMRAAQRAQAEAAAGDMGAEAAERRAREGGQPQASAQDERAHPRNEARDAGSSTRRETAAGEMPSGSPAAAAGMPSAGTPESTGPARDTGSGGGTNNTASGDGETVRSSGGGFSSLGRFTAREEDEDEEEPFEHESPRG